MTDDNNREQGTAGEPQVAEATLEMQSTETPVEDPAPAAQTPPTGNGDSSESTPLGAFRRGRMRPTGDETRSKAIPSLPGGAALSMGAATTTAEPIAASSSAVQTAEPDGSESVGTIADESAATGSLERRSEVNRSAGADGQDSHASGPEERERSEHASSDHDAAVSSDRRPTSAVEIPPPVKDLDAELVAQIDAAMASDDLEAAKAASATAVQEEAAGEEKPSEELLESGQHLTGRIQSIHADSVFLELGYRSPGVIPLRQFVAGKKPEVGQRIEVVVDRVAHDEGLIHLNLPRGLRRVAGNWESIAKGQVVDCIVNRTNKGGLEVTVSGLRAFLPSSQIELGFISDLTPYVGQKLRVEVVEVNARKKNLVVSRRAYLQIERQESEQKFWEAAEVGQTYTGRVKTIKDYGAFVDLGGVDGFLHIGEISWHRIKHPSEIVKEAQTVDVKVLSLDREKKKIGLGMKQLVQNPWTTATERYPANSTVSGTVTRLADFGAFVELEPGLEGLVHVSALDHKRVRHPADVLKVQQVVTAQVLELDIERKRLSLSLKALIARPEEKKAAEEPPPEQPQHRRKGPLKGGTGSGAPGGLFGNPSDFR